MCGSIFKRLDNFEGLRDSWLVILWCQLYSAMQLSSRDLGWVIWSSNRDRLYGEPAWERIGRTWKKAQRHPHAIHFYTYAHIYMLVHTCVDTHTHSHTHTQTHARTHTHTHTKINMHNVCGSCSALCREGRINQVCSSYVPVAVLMTCRWWWCAVFYELVVPAYKHVNALPWRWFVSAQKHSPYAKESSLIHSISGSSIWTEFAQRLL